MFCDGDVCVSPKQLAVRWTGDMPFAKDWIGNLFVDGGKDTALVSVDETTVHVRFVVGAQFGPRTDLPLASAVTGPVLLESRYGAIAYVTGAAGARRIEVVFVNVPGLRLTSIGTLPLAPNEDVLALVSWGSTNGSGIVALLSTGTLRIYPTSQMLTYSTSTQVDLAHGLAITEPVLAASFESTVAVTTSSSSFAVFSVDQSGLVLQGQHSHHVRNVSRAVDRILFGTDDGLVEIRGSVTPHIADPRVPTSTASPLYDAYAYPNVFAIGDVLVGALSYGESELPFAPAVVVPAFLYRDAPFGLSRDGVIIADGTTATWMGPAL
jgi:hypothetical protein